MTAAEARTAQAEAGTTLRSFRQKLPMWPTIGAPARPGCAALMRATQPDVAPAAALALGLAHDVPVMTDRPTSTRLAALPRERGLT